VPAGIYRRLNIKKLQQILGTSLVTLTGSNSPANLALRPVRRVVLDEVDKFDEGGSEADAVSLAEQRTKGQPYPQRRKISTPTTVEGLIWQEFLKGDQRRYFLPCPHCQKEILLAWSPEYTVLPKLGCEAYIFWDKSAKRKDGTWDYDRVEKSAHARCPHCGGEIRDGQKTAMVRAGRWKPTVQAGASFRSRQLSSLYSCTPETSWGKLAVKFLKQKNSLLGVQGFVNGDLAEPWEAQDRVSKRIELVLEKTLSDEWIKILTVDCQAGTPHFWFVVRGWRKNESHGLEAGSCNTWLEIREIQQRHNIRDVAVLIDSGYGARSDAEVYRVCAANSKDYSDEGSGVLLGWMPTKGMPGNTWWRDSNTGAKLPLGTRTIDPFIGQAEGGRFEIQMLEFNSVYFKDLLFAMRTGEGNFAWSLHPQMATEEYFRHLNSETKIQIFNKTTGRTTHEWRLRSSHCPNHLLDCEIMQVAGTAFYGLFALEPAETQS